MSDRYTNFSLLSIVIIPPAVTVTRPAASASVMFLLEVATLGKTRYVGKRLRHNPTAARNQGCSVLVALPTLFVQLLPRLPRIESGIIATFGAHQLLIAAKTVRRELYESDWGNTEAANVPSISAFCNPRLTGTFVFRPLEFESKCASDTNLGMIDCLRLHAYHSQLR